MHKTHFAVLSRYGRAMPPWSQAVREMTAPGLLPHQHHLSPILLTFEMPQSFSLGQGSRSPRTCLGAALGARCKLSGTRTLSWVTSKDAHRQAAPESGSDSAESNQDPVAGVLASQEPGFTSCGSRQTLDNP